MAESKDPRAGGEGVAMFNWSTWAAAAPVVIALMLLAQVRGPGRFRAGLPWVLAATVLLLGTTFSSQCSARALAIVSVEARLFPTPESKVAVYDARSQSWLQFPGATASRVSPAEVRLISTQASGEQTGRTPGLAYPVSGQSYGARLAGSAADVEELDRAFAVLARTRAGQAAIGDVLAREDVTVTLSDEIGLELPNGRILSTGGTAVTEGNHVTISRSVYGSKGPEVLAAMLAHELTHVAQTAAAGTGWWQWPWTTVDREATAHIVQAAVWAEVRGGQRDWEQDTNLRNSLDRQSLRDQIQNNPAYPWWLAPDLHC